MVDQAAQVNEEEVAGLSELEYLKQENEQLRSERDRLLAAVNKDQPLHPFQVELLKMQRHLEEKQIPMIVLFEGRDASGKGGTIRRFIEHLNPRTARVVALPKPTEVEQGQWYFQRYVAALPNPGEICFFDRSWYNRAVVEPVMGFCTPEEHRIFLHQAPLVEEMLVESGITLAWQWMHEPVWAPSDAWFPPGPGACTRGRGDRGSRSRTSSRGTCA